MACLAQFVGKNGEYRPTDKEACLMNRQCRWSMFLYTDKADLLIPRDRGLQYYKYR